MLVVFFSPTSRKGLGEGGHPERALAFLALSEEGQLGFKKSGGKGEGGGKCKFDKQILSGTKTSFP